jgi:hypothetical protein
LGFLEPICGNKIIKKTTLVVHIVALSSESFMAECRNKDKVIINDQCGYLMRTKAATLNEGGVVSGYAFLNSIFLT